MNIAKEDLLTIDGINYITLEVLEYQGKNYAFLNKLINEDEITDEYYIYEVMGDNLILITDNVLLNELLPKFKNEVEKDLKEILNN